MAALVYNDPLYISSEGLLNGTKYKKREKKGHQHQHSRISLEWFFIVAVQQMNFYEMKTRVLWKYKRASRDMGTHQQVEQVSLNCIKTGHESPPQSIPEHSVFNSENTVLGPLWSSPSTHTFWSSKPFIQIKDEYKGCLYCTSYF